jgi:S1-C subfamily serine protease
MSDTERTEFIRRNIASTVRIHVIRYTEGRGVTYAGGTGVIVDSRHILTAAHVVREAEYIRVTIRRLDPDGLTIREITTVPMRVAARDAAIHPDIALLRVKYQDRFVNHMPIAPRGWVPNEGDLLWHFGMTTRWQRGPVIGRVPMTDSRDRVRGTIETDFLVQPGDSGGPVVTPDGRLVGIMLRRDEGSERGFFVTIDDGMNALMRVLGRPLRP